MKKIIILLIFILLSINVFATHTLNYPVFMGVNESEQILITSDDTIINQSAILFTTGLINSFVNISETQFQLFISNTEEIDLPFVILISNASIELEQYNSSDNTRESFIDISDQTIYGFKHNHTDFNHSIDDTEIHFVCPFVKEQLGTPKLTVYVGEPNATNKTQIFWNQGETKTITTNYEYVCFLVAQTYNQNLTQFIEHLSVQCTNCNVTTKVRLGLDTGTITNESFLLDNFTADMENITTSNYMFTTLEQHSEPLEIYMGEFQFRIPFYINISLYNDFNQTLNTKFDYIYLEEYTGYTTSSYSEMGNVFSKYATFGLYDNTATDTTITFWSAVNGNSAIIKLYEANNYTVNLLTVKTFLPNGWNNEFVLPQYSRTKIKTKIDAKLNINNETNQTAYILISEYEANKRGAIVNLVKIILVVLLLFAGLGLSIYTGQLGGIPATAIIVTLLVKLLGIS